MEEAEARIQSGYGLLSGFIERNGVVMRSNDSITTDGNYHFVNFVQPVVLTATSSTCFY